MSWVNKTQFLVQHESCECKCRLNESACNSNQKWNQNKYSWECKELDDWISCKDNYMWHPISSDCEYKTYVKLMKL